MRRFVFAVLIALLSGEAAGAETSPVIVIAYSEPRLEQGAGRLRAELKSAAHSAIVVERRTPLGLCSSLLRRQRDREHVGVVLRLEPEGRVTADICAAPQSNQVNVVTVLGRTDGWGEFSILVTEALHGLLIDPRAAEEPQEDAPPAQVETPPPVGAPDQVLHLVSLSIEPRVNWDVPTGGAWFGVTPGLQFSLSRAFRLSTELFIGIDPIEVSDDEIDLTSRFLWARFGVVGTREFGPVLLAAQLAAGPYFNRVTAEAVAPREGGSDGTPGALLHVGGFAELPAGRRFFLRGSLGASTLLPRLRYQMSGERTPEIGVLLLEGGLALGVRFGRAAGSASPLRGSSSEPIVDPNPSPHVSSP